MIRRFAGGLELLITLLESTDVRVLSCVCATVAEVAKNEDNLAIITDLDVVTYLAKLVSMVSVFMIHICGYYILEKNVRSSTPLVRYFGVFFYIQEPTTVAFLKLST